MADKQVELVQRLSEKTQSRSIQWEPTANLDEFVTAFRGEVTFTIARYDDPNYYGDSIRLTMRDGQGREMLTLDNHASDGTLGDAIRQLYTDAKDEALKVDETLDSILSDLKKVS